VEDISSVVGYEIESTVGEVSAPGTLPVHYQPRARVLLAEDHDEAERLVAEYEREGRHVARLVHVESPPLLAATLYSQLRHADDKGADLIIAELPSTAGLGLAIRDRLMRAAAQ
jgi:L-threonylcarbamoyladenylate synthase